MLHKENRLLRIGVLGAGPIAQIAHLDAARKARNAELYAICDAAPELLHQVAAIHQPRVTYTDYDSMLADEAVEAVIVAVADQFHVPLAQRALAARKHVLVEKPLGVGVDECEALQAELQERDLVFQVGNNRRFDPGLTFAHQFIRERLGPLLSLKAWYYDSAFRYTMTDNLQPIVRRSADARKPSSDPKLDKRRYFLLTHGSHLVDTARFLGGPFRQVQARFVERNGSYCWFVAVEFADGSLGHLDLIVPVQGDFEEGFQLFGERGSVVGRSYLPWYHKASHVECFGSDDRQYHRVLGEDGYSYKRQIEGFADTILHGAQQHGATITDGVAAMRALVAIARSAASGAWVDLADVSGDV